MDAEITPEEKQLLNQFARPAVAPQAQPLDPSLVRWQLDDSVDIDELKNILRGKRLQYNEKKDAWEEINLGGGALLNDYGIRLLIDTIMRAVTSKNIKLSNMTEKDVYLLARLTLNEIARLLFVHGIKEFGIKDLATMSAIMEIMRSNVIAQFKRPYNQGERIFIKGFAQEKQVLGGEKKKLGLFG